MVQAHADAGCATSFTEPVFQVSFPQVRVDPFISKKSQTSIYVLFSRINLSVVAFTENFEEIRSSTILSA
jgi:hypothetical protein